MKSHELTYRPSIAVLMLSALTTLLAVPFRLIKPLSSTLRRVYYLTAAKTKHHGFHGSIQFDGRIDVVGSGNIHMGTQSRIGSDVEFGTEEKGTITIGANVRINRGTTIFAYESIHIGDHTLIGEFVSIRDANHGIAPGENIRSQDHIAKSIKLGKDVWIGRGSVILPGVEIGDHSIIGANSVVSRSIPAGTIALGSPAKPLRKR